VSHSYPEILLPLWILQFMGRRYVKSCEPGYRPWTRMGISRGAVSWSISSFAQESPQWLFCHGVEWACLFDVSVWRRKRLVLSLPSNPDELSIDSCGNGYKRNHHGWFSISKRHRGWWR